MRRSWLRLFWAGVVVAGLAIGYLVTSGLGDRLLHREIETQLGRLLASPVEIAKVDLRLENGIRLEAHDLVAYPTPRPDGPAALRVRRIVAWIDILALLIGRLELSTLVLEGPVLRIEQAADGSFVSLPLPAPDPVVPSDGRSTAEWILQRLESLDASATEFAQEFRLADRIELIDGTLSWIRHGPASDEDAPPPVRLELISGQAERDWLSGAISLDGEAVFVDGRNAPFPVGISVRRRTGPHFDWTLDLSRISLEAKQGPLALIDALDDVSGTLDARFQLSTNDAGAHELHFEGTVEDANVSLRRTRSIINRERVRLDASLVFDPRRLRLVEGRLAGKQLGLDFMGEVPRPITPASRARIETRMVGIEFERIRNFANRIKNDSDLALAIARLVEPVESGRIRVIHAAGTAPLRHWADLLQGRTRDLPQGFLLGGAFEQFRVAAGGEDRIEDLEGEIEWLEDQISLQRVRGVYRGTRLPEMNLIVDGVSHLIRASDAVGTVSVVPPPVPGLRPLLQILRPRDPDALPPVKAIGLAIDHLDHPLFRWPLRDLRVLVEPLRHGMQMRIREGTLGGASIQGDAIWYNDPETPSVNARLRLGPPPEPEAATAPPDRAVAERETTTRTDSGSSRPTRAGSGSAGKTPPIRWGSARFEIGFRPRPRLPFRKATGFARLEGSKLLGSDIEIGLEPEGKAALRVALDLTRPDAVDLDLSFAITGARFEGMSEFVALPPDLVTGQVGATGSLGGPVRPDAPFIAELDGRVRIEAREGRILTSLPLLLRLGKATEGYNPFANADELLYETMTGTLTLDHGRLGIEDFEIEGPLRVYANVRLDTNRHPAPIRAVVGIFLFRSGGEILGNLPLLRSFLPGSDRGLIGAYFKVKGPIDAPDVEALPLKTLMSSVPDAIKAPFKALRFLFGLDKDDS